LLLVLLLIAHLGVREVAQTGQRYELFLLPLAAGAYAALKGKHIRVLEAYVLATTLLAVVWPIHDFGLQKNPVGQVIANAILLIVAVPRLRRLAPCLLALVPGLFLTESRGALGALAIGLALIVVLSGFRLGSVLARTVPVLLLAVGVFAFLPSGVRARVTTFTPGIHTPAAYSLHIRQEFSSDARAIIRKDPWLGVGVGNYARADSASATPTDDPHQVFLLQAAEGGYVLAVAWIVLVAGSCLVLLRMRESEVAVAAIAVLVATAAHGFTDVYWARGTPVLGWFLAGMACAVTYRRTARGAR
jgi:O-antigen ligase